MGSDRNRWRVKESGEEGWEAVGRNRDKRRYWEWWGVIGSNGV